MCQNHKGVLNKETTGIIAVTDKGVLFFFAQSKPQASNPTYFVVAEVATLRSFFRFANHCRGYGLLSAGSSTLTCCNKSIEAFYDDFLEIEFNMLINTLLESQNIYPPVPEVNALSTPLVMGKLNIWLVKTRRWLQFATSAGFFSLKMVAQ